MTVIPAYFHRIDSSGGNTLVTSHTSKCHLNAKLWHLCHWQRTLVINNVFVVERALAIGFLECVVSIDEPVYCHDATVCLESIVCSVSYALREHRVVVALGLKTSASQAGVVYRSRSRLLLHCKRSRLIPSVHYFTDDYVCRHYQR